MASYRSIGILIRLTSLTDAQRLNLLLYPSFACAPHHTASDVISTRKSGAGRPSVWSSAALAREAPSLPSSGRHGAGPSAAVGVQCRSVGRRIDFQRRPRGRRTSVQLIAVGRVDCMLTRTPACPAGRHSCITSALCPAGRISTLTGVRQ